MVEFFDDNTDLILELANTEAGKYLIGKLGEKVEGKIIKITENCFHELVGVNGEELIIKATFFSRHPILDIFAPIIQKMRIAASADYLNEVLEDKHKAFLHYANLENKRNLPQIFLNTATFNPAAGANFPVDGYASREGVNESFATIRAGAGTNADMTDVNIYAEIFTSSTTNNYQVFRRPILNFDTSTLTAGASISSAVFSVFGNFKNNTLASGDTDVAAATPASTSSIASSDYGNIGRTSFATVTYSSFSTSAYNDFTLNASGIANINKTGASSFSLQNHFDLANSAPTWVSASISYTQANSADNGSNKPKLVVTYTLPSGGFFLAAQ